MASIAFVAFVLCNRRPRPEAKGSNVTLVEDVTELRNLCRGSLLGVHLHVSLSPVVLRNVVSQEDQTLEMSATKTCSRRAKVRYCG